MNIRKLIVCIALFPLASAVLFISTGTPLYGQILTPFEDKLDSRKALFLYPGYNFLKDVDYITSGLHDLIKIYVPDPSGMLFIPSKEKLRLKGPVRTMRYYNYTGNDRGEPFTEIEFNRSGLPVKMRAASQGMLSPEYTCAVKYDGKGRPSMLNGRFGEIPWSALCGYDSGGRLKTVDSEVWGKKSEALRADYDDSGRPVMIRSTAMYTDQMKMKFIYNSNRTGVEVYRLQGNDIEELSARIMSDSENKITEIKNYSDGREHTMEFSYNENEYIINKCADSRIGCAGEEITVKFNEWGMPAALHLSIKSGVESMRVDYDSRKRIVKILSEKNSQIWYTEFFRYNNKSNLSSIERKKPEGAVIHTVNFIYDKYGNIISAVQMSGDKKRKVTDRYEYTYY
jgi:hypothetical protein